MTRPKTVTDYQFRRLEDGTWQRRANSKSPWLTLHVIRNPPPESQHRRPGSEAHKAANEWQWL